MILRRLAAAVRRQDWFTVFVETMIVVFGVFIGLQVNNWIEARLERLYPPRAGAILRHLSRAHFSGGDRALEFGALASRAQRL